MQLTLLEIYLIQITRMNTKFFNAEENKDWFDWCLGLLDLYHTDKQFMYKDSQYKASYKSMQKWILAHDQYGTDRILRTLLLDAIVSADMTPGAGIYVPWFIYNDVKLESHRHASEDYKNKTLSKTSCQKTKDLFEKIWTLSGPLTKIMIKKSPDMDTVIRSRDCFVFPVKLDPQFHRMIGQQDQIELVNPIVIMIEGAPETIGEINSLLQKNHEIKRPIILIARNFPEEISATLATNWLKSTLNVLPFLYGDSIDTINLASDMISVTRGELISPHFGDAISVAILDEDKYGTVDRAIWSDRGLSLFSSADVSGHVSKLAAKVKRGNNEELQNIINDRILSLSNDALEVWIPETESFLLEELDSLIKHYGGFVTSGAVNTSLGPLPNSFVTAAQTAAQTLRRKILNIGGFLVRVDDEVVAR